MGSGDGNGGTSSSRKITLTVKHHTNGRKGNSATMTLLGPAAVVDVINKAYFLPLRVITSAPLHLSHRLLKLNTDSACGAEALLYAPRHSIPPNSLCKYGQ